MLKQGKVWIIGVVFMSLTSLAVRGQQIQGPPAVLQEISDDAVVVIACKSLAALNEQVNAAVRDVMPAENGEPEEVNLVEDIEKMFDGKLVLIGKAADTFDQIPIGIGVTGDHGAHAWKHVV